MATGGDPIELSASSSPVACPGMVEAHAVRLILIAHAGSGPKRGYGEHHAGRGDRYEPKIVPCRGRGDLWRSERAESLTLAGGLPGGELVAMPSPLLMAEALDA